MAAPSFAVWMVGALSLLAGAALAAPPAVQTVAGGQGVVSESEVAARDARSVLRRGGSAIDAAITAALVSGVTAPTSSGIGGGGFALYWDAQRQRARVLDFRETAPGGAVREPLERRPLSPNERGHLVGVPGEVKGLFALHQAGGKLPWSELVEVAARRAQQGFFVSPHLAHMLASYGSHVREGAGFAGYFPGGQPAPLGRRLTNPTLGSTLEKIARLGPSGFYEGEVAEDFVAAARIAGSPMTLDDLRSYAPKEREPIAVEYDGVQVYTMPPPSAGGLMLAQALAMFPPDDLRKLGFGKPAYQHALAESMRGSIADRARFLGDPDFVAVPLEQLLERERLDRRRSAIGLDRTHAIPRFGQEEQGTHALITADRQGNVVSLTTTINAMFGARIVALKSGVVLNDELDDFAARSSVAAFGLSDSPNQLRPGARPVSSMTPTIAVQDGAAFLALGGSGGTKIATNVTQVALGALVFGQSPEQAVRAPRFAVPFVGATLQLPAGASEEQQRELEWRGEILGPPVSDTSAVQLMRVVGGRWQGAADPRKHGGAAID